MFAFETDGDAEQFAREWQANDYSIRQVTGEQVFRGDVRLVDARDCARALMASAHLLARPHDQDRPPVGSPARAAYRSKPKRDRIAHGTSVAILSLREPYYL